MFEFQKLLGTVDRRNSFQEKHTPYIQSQFRQRKLVHLWYLSTKTLISLTTIPLSSIPRGGKKTHQKHPSNLIIPLTAPMACFEVLQQRHERTPQNQKIVPLPSNPHFYFSHSKAKEERIRMFRHFDFGIRPEIPWQVKANVSFSEKLHQASPLGGAGIVAQE